MVSKRWNWDLNTDILTAETKLLITGLYYLSISRPMWGKMLNTQILDYAPWLLQNLIIYSFKSLSCNSADHKALNLWFMRFKYFCCSSLIGMCFQFNESSVSLKLTIFHHSQSYFNIINLFQILHEKKPCSQVMTGTLLLTAGKYLY